MSASTSTATAARIQAKAFGMEARRTNRPPVSVPAASGAGRSGLGEHAPRRGGACGRVREHGGGEPDHAPGQRILEEPGVQQRVDEERHRHGREADAERALGRA